MFNLGSGRQIAINDLARYVITAYGRASCDYPIIHQPGRPGEQRWVEADVSQAHAVLGWEPRVPFEVGLPETVRWAAGQMAPTMPRG